MAQKAPSGSLNGSLKGVVRDTVHNYVLKSATAAVYKVGDITLYSYQITNGYGEFNFKNLPVNVPLKLEITHIGYQPFYRNFTIQADSNVVNLKTLIIEPKIVTLNEVTISVPPVTMNGDTLEFNASAFKLDSNAVVEDMLREVPNVTLWGDGTITVNGQQIKTLKVNGKAFFGGEFKTALQNIAKSALQKVQVYKSAESLNNPLDSTFEMNLKLKKGKDFGYFGKIGGGYGTNNRFESDVSINVFSPRLQIAIIGASNNINKSAGNIQTLVANSTFKGVGANIDYQPDFKQSGQTQSNTAGASFNYNFIEKPDFYNKSELNAEYFLQNINNDYSSKTLTTTTLDANNKVFEQNNTINSTTATNQKQKSSYEWVEKKNALNFSQFFNLKQGDDNKQTLRTAEDGQHSLTSTNNTFGRNNFKNADFGFKAEYKKTPASGEQNGLLGDLHIIYQLNGSDGESHQLNVTEFKSFVDASNNQKFNRKYDTHTNNVNQQIDLEIGDLMHTYSSNRLAGIIFSFTNKLTLDKNKENDKVADLDTLSKIYKENDFLTNQFQTNRTEETPGLIFKKNIVKRLSNRFNKNLNIIFSLKQTFVSFESNSQRSFQNLTYNYNALLPDASIAYNNYQYGEFNKTYNLSYSTSLNTPTIQQLAPLTDSSNVYYLQKGNLGLRASITRRLSFSYNRSDQKISNPLSYGLQIAVGQTDNNIVDSILIDNQNRRTIYPVNANGNKFLNANLNIKKAIKLHSSELQFEARTFINMVKNPGYINNVFTSSNNLNTDSHLDVYFSYNRYIVLGLDESYSTYTSKQSAFDTEYKGKNVGTTFRSSFNITKRFTLNTNINFNSSSSSNSQNIKFTIWNASALYRFLKGNNAELKISALDLLHQNTSVINYGSANSFTIGTQNVLKQYFMATFSYYPRQFGAKKHAK